MPPPTLPELRTARAIIRAKRASAEMLGIDKSEIEVFNLAERNFDERINEMEKKEQETKPSFTIANDSINRFTIIFDDGQRLSTCPCCDKTLLRRDVAETLARNLVNLPAEQRNNFIRNTK